MSKKFKSKKQRKKRFMFQFIFIVIIIIILYNIVSSFILKIKLTSSNEEFLKELLKDSNHHLIYEQENNNIVNKLLDNLYQIDLKKPLTILKNIFNYEEDMSEMVVTSSDNTIEPVNSGYIEDPDPQEVTNPRVYIYNTHQTENYSYKKYEEYNITPNVMMSSYILREKLNKKGIATTVETSNVSDLLNANGWNYASSYKASRYFIEDTLKKYSSLELIIDLHRDSIKKSASTIEINSKKYAKVLFVIGKEYKTYEKNLNVANTLNTKINEKYKGLSRGVMLKSGENVNGIYNQDLSPNIILMECGGSENSIDEVMNTLEIIADVIEEYLGEKNES
jgi:stage II sporulation protein P